MDMDRQNGITLRSLTVNLASTHDSHDGVKDEPSELSPLYGALSPHHSASRKSNRHVGSSSFRGPNTDIGPHSNIVDDSPEQPNSSVNKPSSLWSSSVDPASLSPRSGDCALAQVSPARKNSSWISVLPFASSLSTTGRRVRRSVLSEVHDLVVQPSRQRNSEPKNMHDLLDSMAESCKEHKLSLSAILQERSIADHTPMYWAIVNYREELLVALLIHSQPLSIRTVSDIRRACLASSNQKLFHALRVCCHPFHETQGLHVPSPRAASDSLLLGSRPMDRIDVQQSSDKAFAVSFYIHLWQRRMNAIGQASIEFIAAGRMWSVTFFSPHPSSSLAISGKREKDADTWHVMVRLLESSLPTYFNSNIIIDALPLVVEESNQTQTLRGAPSVTRSRSKRAAIDPTPSEKHRSPSSSRPINPPSPSSSPRLISNACQPTICIALNSSNHKLGCRSKLAETLTTKPDNWSDHGVDYTSAIVSPLGDAMPLLSYESPYLFSDGTLRGRLEVDCIRSDSHFKF